MSRRHFIFLASLFVGATGSSQTSRHELLRKQREEKQAQATPYEPNRVEEQMVRLDKAESPTIADWNLKGFYPRIAWPSRGSGAALGFRYWQRDFWGRLDAAGAAFYSLRQYQHYDIQLGLMPHVGRRIPRRSWRGDDVYDLASLQPDFTRFPFYATMRFRYLPQEDFFGLGPDASLENRTNYLQEESRIYLTTGWQFTPHFVWIVNGGYHGNEIRSGQSKGTPSTEGIFDDPDAPGFSNPPKFIRFGTQLLFDHRDEPGNPHGGFMAAFSFERFDDRTEDAFNFDRFGIDLRGYIPLGSPQRILALRAGIQLNEAQDGNHVPFFLQPSLGGSHTLRGFDSFRWRGERVMLYQAEYRWEPATFWDLDAFIDTGAVSAPGEGLSFSNLQWDWGFGTRFKTYRDIVLRLEIAFSNETTRYYFRGSTSF